MLTPLFDAERDISAAITTRLTAPSPPVPSHAAAASSTAAVSATAETAPSEPAGLAVKFELVRRLAVKLHFGSGQSLNADKPCV